MALFDQQGNPVDYERVLTRFSLNDEPFLASVLQPNAANIVASGLDGRTHALVRLGSLLALDASPAAYQSSAELALAAGATVGDIVGVLVAVAPTIGVARAVSSAPELALAIGFDVEDALER